MNDTVERLHDVEERAGRSMPLWPFVIVFLVLGVLGVQGWRLMSMVDKGLAFSAPTPVAAPSASWDELYTLAQREATEIDPRAVLSGVEAWSPASSPFGGYKNWDQISPDTSLRLWFKYEVPAGEYITLYMSDNTPTATLQVSLERYGGPKETPTAEQLTYYDTARLRLAELGSNIDAITITPRQAMASTWSAAADYGRQMQQFDHVAASPSIALRLDQNPPAWSVSYTMIDPTRPTRDRAQGPIAVDEVKTSFLVNATTGKILKADPTPTITTP